MVTAKKQGSLKETGWKGSKKGRRKEAQEAGKKEAKKQRKKEKHSKLPIRYNQFNVVRENELPLEHVRTKDSVLGSSRCCRSGAYSQVGVSGKRGEDRADFLSLSLSLFRSIDLFLFSIVR